MERACVFCGSVISADALPSHVRTCPARLSASPHTVCDACGRRVLMATMLLHRKTCRGAPAAGETASPGSDNASTRRVACPACGVQMLENALALHQQSCIGATDMSVVDAAYQSFKKALVPCKQCGKTFLPDRLAVHEGPCLRQAGKYVKPDIPPMYALSPQTRRSSASARPSPATSTASRITPPSQLSRQRSRTSSSSAAAPRLSTSMSESALPPPSLATPSPGRSASTSRLPAPTLAWSPTSDTNEETGVVAPSDGDAVVVDFPVHTQDQSLLLEDVPSSPSSSSTSRSFISPRHPLYSEVARGPVPVPPIQVPGDVPPGSADTVYPTPKRTDRPLDTSTPVATGQLPRTPPSVVRTPVATASSPSSRIPRTPPSMLHTPGATTSPSSRIPRTPPSAVAEMRHCIRCRQVYAVSEEASHITACTAAATAQVLPVLPVEVSTPSQAATSKASAWNEDAPIRSAATAADAAEASEATGTDSPVVQRPKPLIRDRDPAAYFRTCPKCGRSFAKTIAPVHIPKCKESIEDAPTTSTPRSKSMSAAAAPSPRTPAAGSGGGGGGAAGRTIRSKSASGASAAARASSLSSSSQRSKSVAASVPPRTASGTSGIPTRIPGPATVASASRTPRQQSRVSRTSVSGRVSAAAASPSTPASATPQRTGNVVSASSAGKRERAASLPSPRPAGGATPSSRIPKPSTPSSRLAVPSPSPSASTSVSPGAARSRIPGPASGSGARVGRRASALPAPGARNRENMPAAAASSSSPSALQRSGGKPEPQRRSLQALNAGARPSRSSPLSSCPHCRKRMVSVQLMEHVMSCSVRQRKAGGGAARGATSLKGSQSSPSLSQGSNTAAASNRSWQLKRSSTDIPSPSPKASSSATAAASSATTGATATATAGLPVLCDATTSPRFVALKDAATATSGVALGRQRAAQLKPRLRQRARSLPPRGPADLAMRCGSCVVELTVPEARYCHMCGAEVDASTRLTFVEAS